MAVSKTDFNPAVSVSPLIVYFDIKSPYAFVAKDPTYALADELGIDIDWRPLTLDIPSYLGSARLDKSGKVATSNRTAEQWGGVRYAYMDARRYASAWGYGLRGTEKIWDTSLVHIGFSWVKRRAPEQVRTFLDLAYPRFWLRDLDVENLQVVTALIESCGVSSAGFEEWAAGDGRNLHDAEQAAIFARGIYGVPGYIHKGDYYFGREHLPHVRQLLLGNAAGRVDTGYSLPTPHLLERKENTKHSVFIAMAEAARAGSLTIDAGINGSCVQTRLALKTIEELQHDFPGQLSVRYGDVEPQKLQATANSTLHSVPDSERAEQAQKNRSEAHMSFRSRYESADLHRYQEWRSVGESEQTANRFAKITFDPAATKTLQANGIGRSFGFVFVDNAAAVHPFKGRAHLQLLRWSLENAS